MDSGGFLVLILIVVVVLAVLALRGFDSIAGRGPKQVSDGIKHSGLVDGRPPTLSVADELAKLAALRDQGAISQDEFDAQKRRLLA
jgi:hypothetical protein